MRTKSYILYFMIPGLVALSVLGCDSSSRTSISGDKIREYAVELYNRQLFEQSIVQYRLYLDKFQPDEKEQASITYQIGNIYFERLRDYQNALAEFLKIRTLYPESPLISEVNKKVVACLERMQRPEDAQQALKETTAFENQKPQSRPGEVVAVFGGRSFTQGDLEFEIGKLPPEIRAQYLRKENRIEFLRRYITTELLYDSAKRQGLDQDKGVLENSFQAKKSFMVDKLLQQEIGNKINLDEEDVRLYYEARKEDFAEKDDEGNIKRIPPLGEIQSEVARRLVQDRQQKVMQEYISSLLRAEDVKIYDDLVK